MNIEFVPMTKEVEKIVPMPKPAKNYIPDWYKNVKLGKDKYIDSFGSLEFDGKMKKCVPFLDALTHGYIQESWTDIYVKNNNGTVEFAYAKGPEIIGVRDKISISVSNNFYPIEFIWRIQWMPKLPKGWSVILTSPYNRLDLPFRSLTGIIDSDHFYHGDSGNYPFYIQNGFEGIIPVGTPMYQIVPIKRENWRSSAMRFDEEDASKRVIDIKKYFVDGYRKAFWQKKSFE